MSCEKNSNKVASAAGRSGINPTDSKRGFTAGSTVQLSFFAPTGRGRVAKRRQRRDDPSERTAQVPFFEREQPADVPQPAPAGALPTRRQIYIRGDFTPAELTKLTVQLRLGEAAAARQVRELSRGQARGTGHSDPRPLDWAQADQQQYRFLSEQVRRARWGRGHIDTSALKKGELAELWAFARFEADRAQRNIDHLTSGLSHLKGPTADYLTGGHKLEARFYNFLADQLEQIVPEDSLAKAAENW